MKTSDLEAVLACHQALDIPLQHSVAFVYRVMGLNLTATAERAGYSRNTFYKALAGDRTPSARLREAVREDLGIDVWAER